jgi:hypothetical protein
MMDDDADFQVLADLGRRVHFPRQYPLHIHVRQRSNHQRLLERW